jgi:diaminopimelate epimerase
VEDVMNIIEMEQPDGVIATLGGQTAIKRAENRDSFEKLLYSLNIPQPKGMAVTSIEDGIKAASEIGYPVLVRPSFVLGGRAMQIVAKEEALYNYLKTAVEIDKDKPVLVDKYIRGKEVEVDAICDGREVTLIPVSVGNPHAVIFVNDIENAPTTEVGPALEHHQIFPKGVNVEFVRIISPNELRMRVWERGSGITMACGTGACATVMAAISKGVCEREKPISVHLDGGTLKIEVDYNNNVTMTGPATTVYEGETDL